MFAIRTEGDVGVDSDCRATSLGRSEMGGKEREDVGTDCDVGGIFPDCSVSVNDDRFRCVGVNPVHLEVHEDGVDNCGLGNSCGLEKLESFGE